MYRKKINIYAGLDTCNLPHNRRKGTGPGVTYFAEDATGYLHTRFYQHHEIESPRFFWCIIRVPRCAERGAFALFKYAQDARQDYVMAREQVHGEYACELFGDPSLLGKPCWPGLELRKLLCYEGGGK